MKPNKKKVKNNNKFFKKNSQPSVDYLKRMAVKENSVDSKEKTLDFKKTLLSYSFYLKEQRGDDTNIFFSENEKNEHSNFYNLPKKQDNIKFFYKNFLPLILEEGRANIEQGLENVKLYEKIQNKQLSEENASCTDESQNGKPFNLILHQKLASPKGSVFTFDGEIPVDIEHSTTMNALLLIPKKTHLLIEEVPATDDDKLPSYSHRLFYDPQEKKWVLNKRSTSSSSKSIFERSNLLENTSDSNLLKITKALEKESSVDNFSPEFSSSLEDNIEQHEFGNNSFEDCIREKNFVFGFAKETISKTNSKVGSKIKSKIDLTVGKGFCHSIDEKYFEPHTRWKTYFLGSLVSELRMYDACIRATQIPVVSAIAEASLEEPIISQSANVFQQELKSLNSPQKDAIKGFLSAKNGTITLLQGPPGTGKTTTLVALLKVLSTKKERVLVSAHSNKAVQVVAERFLKENPTVPIILVGINRKIPEHLQSISLDGWYNSLESTLFEMVKFSEKLQKSQLKVKKRLDIIKNNVKLLQENLIKFDLLEGKESLFYSDKSTRLVSYFCNINEIDQIKSQLKQPDEKEKFDKLYDLFSDLHDRWCKLKKNKLEEHLLNFSIIIFSTLVSAGRKKVLDMDKIDSLIVDEAGQSVEAATLIPMQCEPNKVLLVGDTKQLPATVISKNLQKKSHYDWSMMWRLIEECKQPSFMLTIQHRMHQEICAFPSQQYYHNKLITAAFIKLRQSLAQQGIASRACAFYDVPDLEEDDYSKKILCNTKQAIYVENIISNVRKSNISGSVGVITPYRSQKKLIQSKLEKSKLLDGVRVNTADGFQGDESDVIIFSLVRTRVTRFLEEFRRLNVAITRAKHCLIILGSVEGLGAREGNDIGQLIQNLRERGKIYTESDLRQMLNMPVLKNELKNQNQVIQKLEPSSSPVKIVATNVQNQHVGNEKNASGQSLSLTVKAHDLNNKKLTKKENYESIYELGKKQADLGTKDSYELAAISFKKVALKFPDAGYRLALCLKKLDKSETEIFSAYLSSANNGYLSAQCEVADRFLVGKGCSKNESLAMEWYTKASGGGHISSKYHLACLLRKKDDLDSQSKAFNYFYAYHSANAKDYSSEAYENLCQMHELKQYCTTKNELALAYLDKCQEKTVDKPENSSAEPLPLSIKIDSVNKKSSAKEEDCFSIYELGKKQANLDTKDSYELAVVNLEKVKSKYSDAGYHLARCLKKLDKSETEIFSAYLVSAINNYPDAQCEVANRRLIGKGCKKDRASALKWYEKATKEGHMISTYRLACLLREKPDFKSNLVLQSEVFNYFYAYCSENAKDYFSEAYENLCQMHELKQYCTTKNELALAYLDKCQEKTVDKPENSSAEPLPLSIKIDSVSKKLPAKKEDCFSIYELGKKQADLDTKDSYELAAISFKEVALEFPDAGYRLALCLKKLDKSETEIFSAYLSSANNGYLSAQCEVADRFLVGKGCSKDELLALEWYTKASRGGHLSSKYHLACLLRKKDDLDSQSKAFNYFYAYHSANAKDYSSEAYENLCQMHELKQYCTTTNELALKYLEKRKKNNVTDLAASYQVHGLFPVDAREQDVASSSSEYEMLTPTT